MLSTSTSKATKKRKTTTHKDTFPSLRDYIADQFVPTGPYFTTDAKHLFAAFIKALPPSRRQEHNCSACHRFLSRHGGLVTIDEAGKTSPVMWGKEGPGIYAKAVAELRRLVSRAKVTGVFLTSEPVWGIPCTGHWTHMAVTPNPEVLFVKSPLKTAGQARAEKCEDFATLLRGLSEIPVSSMNTAEMLIKAEALYRHEKVKGPLTFLQLLHNAREAAKGETAKRNVTWLAVAKAPAGFCHPRTTMVGTLLEDITAGLSLDVVKAKFTAKMSPLQYQRPQVAPTAGQLAAAEKVVSELRSAGSLARRFARIDEIPLIWNPTQTKKAGGSVFGHIVPKGQLPNNDVLTNGTTMTWEKFASTILPTTTEISLFVKNTVPFIAMTTTEDMKAPPILQWDLPERRNPVAWYVYSGGVPPHACGLTNGSWARVTGVCQLPTMWNGGNEHQGAGVILLLEGCRDVRNNGGLALFPECLKSDYHGIRSSIEAYSRAGKISGEDEASACGYDLRKGGRWGCDLMVLTRGVKMMIHLDRWD